MAYDGILANSKTVIDYKTMPPPTYKEMVDFYTKAKVPTIVWGTKEAPIPYVEGCDCALCRAARGEMKANGVVNNNDLSVLKGARARIAYGWCQGAMQSGNQVCAVGAIVAALQGLERPDTMPRDVELYLEHVVRHLPGIRNPGDLIRFNDSTSTTKAEVLRLFDQGIAKLEAQGMTEPPSPSIPPERRPFLTKFMMDIFA